LSTAFHPQTDGQTERINQEIEQYLRLFINHRQWDWVNWLPMVEFTYNNRMQSSTRSTPFLLNFGQHPRMGHEPHRSTSIEAVDIFLSAIAHARDDAKAALTKAASDMKKYYDKHHGETPKYTVGDKVWLDASNVTMDRPMKKLDHKRLGPYTITKVLSNNAYQLKLPTSMKVYPVFSVVFVPMSPMNCQNTS
jgi:hypothetical protein